MEQFTRCTVLGSDRWSEFNRC